jgi:hypothetical protein
MSTDNPNQDPFAVPSGTPQQQADPFAVPGQADDPFAAPDIQRNSWAPHRGSKVLIFGVLGMVVCFPFGIAAWVMGTADLKRMQAGEMDPGGRGVTTAGKIVGTVATFLNPLAILVNLAPLLENM